MRSRILVVVMASAMVLAFSSFLTAQQPGGNWTFNWMAWSPVAEREWNGIKTVEALHILRANGRL